MRDYQPALTLLYAVRSLEMQVRKARARVKEALPLEGSLAGT
ncbi:hypothetical protein OG762_19400 [Streptomyces sp. NBC_01136]|nr:hypothetical protein OG762_19400 [Streptomyces sp. NBC_01136]